MKYYKLQYHDPAYLAVSNSSSSSFVVPREFLTDEQVAALVEFCSKPVGEYKDSWSIHTSSKYVSGVTYMVNNTEGDGGLVEWLQEHEYPLSKFTFEDD